MSSTRKIGYKSLTWIQDIGLAIVAIATLIAVGAEIAKRGQSH